MFIFPEQPGPESLTAQNLGTFSDPAVANTGPKLQHIPEGFPFTSASLLRRYTEPATFALYPYIAGLTVMNDRIAAAVDHHSGFREHPWGRLLSTANAATTLVFGNELESLAMADHLWHFHTTVRGKNENIYYSANDGTLQTWVLACVFNGLEQTNRRWSKPPGSERADLYQDMKTFGNMFGIHNDLLPVDVDALDDYWEKTIQGDSLLQTDVSRRMAQTVFRFSSPKVPSPVARIGQAIAIASLEAHLQDRAGIQPSTLENRIAAAVDIIMQQTYGRTPHKLREQAIPTYLAMRRRLAPVVGRIAAARS